MEKILPVDWDEVHPRNIIKTSIPIFLLEEIGNECIVKAERFGIVVDQDRFIHSQELKNRLQYNPNEKTIIVPCADLPEEKSRFNLWIVDEEDRRHGTKYEYFITIFNQTERN